MEKNLKIKIRKYLVSVGVILLFLILLFLIRVQDRFYRSDSKFNSNVDQIWLEINEKLRNLSQREANTTIHLVTPLLVEYLSFKSELGDFFTEEECSKEFNVSFNNLTKMYSQQDFERWSKVLNSETSKEHRLFEKISSYIVDQKIKKCSKSIFFFTHNKTKLEQYFNSEFQTLNASQELIKEFFCGNRYKSYLFKDGNHYVILKFSYFYPNDRVYNLPRRTVDEEFMGRVISLRYVSKNEVLTHFPEEAFYSENEYALNHLCK